MQEGEGIKVANKGCHCLDCWQTELILSIVFLATIPLAILVATYLIAIPIIIYLIRMVVLCRTDTRKFLTELDLSINPYEHTDKLQKTPPYTRWSIRCYHYERRTRRVKTKNGWRTQSYRVTVYTHHNSCYITYPGVVDASPILSGLEKYRMTRIYNTMRIAFATQEAQAHYFNTRKQWIRNNDLDRYYYFSDVHYLDGLK